MRSPSGGEARRRGGTQVGKAPPSPEMTISGLTKGQFVGDDDVAKQFIIPRLCRTVRPAPQAGCFVSGLSVSCESQITLRHRAFGTVALAPSRTLVGTAPAAPLHGGLLPAVPVLMHLFQLQRANRSGRAAHHGTWSLARLKILTPKRRARPCRPAGSPREP